ncbi:hypothetical protein F5887DRAFT_1283386 [Amanita rubescens]|nr:hypothetical protein F5887DRAFT_1283386 [Amanita rubescens]
MSYRVVATNHPESRMATRSYTLRYLQTHNRLDMMLIAQQFAAAKEKRREVKLLKSTERQLDQEVIERTLHEKHEKAAARHEGQEIEVLSKINTAFEEKNAIISQLLAS